MSQEAPRQILEVLLTAKIEGDIVRVRYHGTVPKGQPRPESVREAILEGASFNAVNTWLGVYHEVPVFGIDMSKEGS